MPTAEAANLGATVRLRRAKAVARAAADADRPSPQARRKPAPNAGIRSIAEVDIALKALCVLRDRRALSAFLSMTKFNAIISFVILRSPERGVSKDARQFMQL